MHVLLTRPLEDSIDLIKRFKNKGLTVSHLPLIKINKLDHPKLYSSEYKRRQAAPGVKISERNFGYDRRYPITNSFRDMDN